MDQPLKSPRELRSTNETGNRHSFSLDFDNQTRAVCKVVSQASIQDDSQGTVLWRLSQDSEIGFMGVSKMTEPQIRLGPWLESVTAVSNPVSDGIDGL